ncbi:hypothetical protein BJ508DRAFT_307629 [Ascobolus immersus RN42]|uniref:Uncharacterized protein n=1 Tax=Ascobolus immersus RN42 TaxID=1160509 RepID=A0A3N4I2A8_ASCIM|nr:hypothetical protein BJ508DRAFT_307629 [Ascobolus immersus RN42]
MSEPSLAPTEASPQGKPRPLPATYQPFVDKCASHGIEMGIYLSGLSPANVPPNLYPFLSLCEQTHKLIAYDQVLHDYHLTKFCELVGVSEFIVMMYTFPDKEYREDGTSRAFDTVDDVFGTWTHYMVVFVNRDGYLFIQRIRVQKRD